MEYNSLEIQWLGDSLHYTVNQKGELFFSSQDTNTILSSGVFLTNDSDTVSDYFTKMTEMFLPVSTPLGTFNACNAKKTHQGQPSYLIGEFTRYLNRYHAENIGIIRETVRIFANDTQHRERRLLSYSVQ